MRVRFTGHANDALKRVCVKRGGGKGKGHVDALRASESSGGRFSFLFFFVCVQQMVVSRSEKLAVFSHLLVTLRVAKLKVVSSLSTPLQSW